MSELSFFCLYDFKFSTRVLLLVFKELCIKLTAIPDDRNQRKLPALKTDSAEVSPQNLDGKNRKCWGWGFAELIFLQMFILKHLGVNASMPFDPKMSRWTLTCTPWVCWPGGDCDTCCLEDGSQKKESAPNLRKTPAPKNAEEKMENAERQTNCRRKFSIFQCSSGRAYKGTELRWQREPKTQIFAENRRFSQIHPFSWKFKHLEGAGNRRKPQIFSENRRFSQKTRRKPQIGLRHLRSVTFSSALVWGQSQRLLLWFACPMHGFSGSFALDSASFLGRHACRTKLPPKNF